MKKTYSELVKNELCRSKFDLISSKYFLKSFFLNNLTKKNSNGQEFWIIQTHFPFIARFVIRITKKLYNLKVLQINFNHTNPSNIYTRKKYNIKFVGNFQQIISDLDLNNINLNLNNLELKNAKAFLIGAFISGGSINSPQNGDYHLEFQSFDINYLILLNEILNVFNITNKKKKIKKRRNKYFLYLKKSETIADVLKFMGVTETLFEFEDLRIERDLLNNVRRLNNFDISNLQKIAKSSIEIIHMIKLIKKQNKFDDLSDKLKLYCEIRLEQQEISLSTLASEMSNRLGQHISRSAVWYMTNKIKKIYETCL